jgi:diguanylate cyclase (GGDEF)-like protein
VCALAFEPPLTAPTSDEDVIEALLGDGALRPVFQPIVRVADGGTVGYEALCRSAEPLPGTPSDWFGLASAIGRRVELERACLHAIGAAGDPPDGALLFVNVSPALLMSPGAERLRRLLPRRLVLELTERDQIEDLAGLQEALEPWVRSGARLAIDDAGAGYSSLKQIVQLRPEFLKLDRSLITGIEQDHHRQAMVAALAGFASEIGANLVAEGVETPGELAWLRASEVTLVQGFLLARPAPPWVRPRPVERGPATRAPRLDRLQRELQASTTQRQACAAVAAHLFRSGGLMPSVYLELGGRLRCQAQRGLWQVLDGMEPTAGITGRTYRTGEVHHVPDIRLAHDYLEAIPGVVAELCVPLTREGTPIGALNVESVVPLTVASREEVEQCGEMLSHRLADLSPEQSRVPLRRLATTAASLVAVDDPAATVAAVLRAACELSEMDSAMLALLGDDGDLRVRGAVGPLSDALASVAADELGYLFGVLAPLTSCYTAGDATGRTVSASETLRAAGARALVALPLIARGRRTGLILVTNRSPLQLGPDEVEPLELLAILAGSCVEMAATVNQLRLRATRDPLTGLGNHSSFHEAIAGLDPLVPATVLMLDIDGFKRVNDHLGHLAGDEVLRQTSEHLRQIVGNTDALFRVGGDEFAVLLTGDSAGDATELAQLLTSVGDEMLADHQAGLSVGVARRGADESGLDALGRADADLYRSKRSRRRAADAGRDLGPASEGTGGRHPSRALRGRRAG